MRDSRLHRKRSTRFPHGYNDGVRRLLAIVVAVPLFAQQVTPGNFNVYVEPTAKLQTDAPIPFQIRVTDALNKPLVDATVSLQIETADGRYVQVFRAPAVDRGVYLATPSSRPSGVWDIH